MAVENGFDLHIQRVRLAVLSRFSGDPARSYAANFKIYLMVQALGSYVAVRG
jgi:hypothetical protein